MNRKIRVLVVEDSGVVRTLLREIIDHDARLEVAAEVATAEEALRVIHRVSPDVVTMDVRLPGMNGLEATQHIMRDKPTPIVVVSAGVADEEFNITMNALRAGALAVVEKPVGVTHLDYRAIAERLCTQLVIMSEVRVVRQCSLRRTMPGATEVAGSPGLRTAAGGGRPGGSFVAGGRYRVLGMAASTGGPNALVHVLGALPADYPLPILLVQHIGGAFLDGFVAWLNGACRLTVVSARGGERPRAGHVYLPPGDCHLAVDPRGLLALTSEAPVGGQRPSADVLFASLARTHRAEAVGVILTGMGADGAAGMRLMREAGAYTVAEDMSTAVVYGMPAEAVRLGAVCESLPLQDIAARLLELTASGKEGA